MHDGLVFEAGARSSLGPSSCPYSPKCLERLSEKGWEAARSCVSRGATSRKKASPPRLVDSWSRFWELVRSFRTVSEVKFSEVWTSSHHPRGRRGSLRRRECLPGVLAR